MEPTPQSKHDGQVAGERVVSSVDVSLDRRALLRAGAGVSPVLLSLVSRPVVASTTCTVASSFVSVATWRSHNPATTSPQCTTRTCDDWLAEAMLPTRSAALKQSLSSVLGTTTSPYSGTLIWQLLINNGAGISTSGELGVAQHLACLALDAQNSMYMPAPGAVTAGYVASVWQSYKSGGNLYKTASGLNWDSSQVIAWARMLMYPSVV